MFRAVSWRRMLKTAAVVSDRDARLAPTCLVSSESISAAMTPSKQGPPVPCSSGRRIPE